MATPENIDQLNYIDDISLIQWGPSDNLIINLSVGIDQSNYIDSPALEQEYVLTLSGITVVIHSDSITTYDLTADIDVLLTKNQQLGIYTFTDDPTTMSVIHKKRSATYIETIDGVQFYSWGTFVAGREMLLHWNYMTTGQFDNLVTLYEADTQVVWRPRTDTTGTTDYNVQITGLTGDYWIDTGAGTHRENVNLSLLIISEVS